MLERHKFRHSDIHSRVLLQTHVSLELSVGQEIISDHLLPAAVLGEESLMGRYCTAGRFGFCEATCLCGSPRLICATEHHFLPGVCSACESKETVVQDIPLM